jgi:hypothetical protein
MPPFLPCRRGLRIARTRPAGLPPCPSAAPAVCRVHERIAARCVRPVVCPPRVACPAYGPWGRRPVARRRWTALSGNPTRSCDVLPKGLTAGPVVLMLGDPPAALARQPGVAPGIMIAVSHVCRNGRCRPSCGAAVAHASGCARGREGRTGDAGRGPLASAARDQGAHAPLTSSRCAPYLDISAPPGQSAPGGRNMGRGAGTSRSRSRAARPPRPGARLWRGAVVGA